MPGKNQPQPSPAEAAAANADQKLNDPAVEQAFAERNPFATNGPVVNPFSPDGGSPLPAVDEEFEEDFTDVEGMKLVAEGIHPMMLISFEKTNAKNGNPQYEWEFKITAGDDVGTRLRAWTSLVPQARWKVVEFLEALGIPSMGSVVRFKKSDLIGKACYGEVFTDTYNNRKNNKINRINLADGACIEAMRAYLAGQSNIPGV